MILQENTKKKVKQSDDIYKITKELLASRQDTEKHKEYFYTFYLDSQNIIKCIDLSSFGTVNHCQPIIREILRLALIKDAISIIVIHNHPSNTLEASQQDKIFKQKLYDSCVLLGIRLLDSMIYCDNEYFSFADKGIL